MKRAAALAPVVLLLSAWLSLLAHADEGIIRVLLFHSPHCSHCEEVRLGVLRSLQEQYGERLQIVLVDVSLTDGYQLYQSTMDQLDVPEARRGFPTLLIGENVLMGSREITAQLPGLVAGYAERGGVDLPAVPGLSEGLAQLAPQPEKDWRDRFLHDPIGNSISVFVLTILLACLVAVLRPQAWQEQLAQRLYWGVPILALAGLVVASYLAYVEVTHTEPYCGPIGDCGTVQQSRYALLLGFLPVGMFGALGYLTILGTWACAHWVKDRAARLARVLLFMLTAFGTLFSTYLTFLEPFVIGATCAWCLTSAVCMALLLLLTAGPAWAALGEEVRTWRATPN